MITRRGLITGLATFLAAPAIVRAGSLMPVKAWADDLMEGELNELALEKAIAAIRGRWVDSYGLRIFGEPDRILSWDELCRTPEMIRNAVYDTAPDVGTPTVCGLFNPGRWSLTPS